MLLLFFGLYLKNNFLFILYYTSSKKVYYICMLTHSKITKYKTEILNKIISNELLNNKCLNDRNTNNHLVSKYKSCILVIKNYIKSVVLKF